MKLSPHFSLAEMTVSQEAARKGIDNYPPSKIIENLKVTAGVLEKLRTILQRPIYISSGYRSIELNNAIGGAQPSAHCKGLAADINCPGMAPKDLALVIQNSGVAYDQLILEFDSWVHIGLSEKPPRNEVMTIRKGTGYMKGIK